jgi:hypothetical protein|tara:strand:+ start:124 stop:684 length:561 start_codon:yes stop_codon:yes gene_type:complete
MGPVDHIKEDPVVIKSLLPFELVDYAFNLWRKSGLQFVDDNGQVRDRVSASAVGKFIVSYWTQDEFKPIMDHIKDKIEEHVPDATFNDFRILKYTKGCSIPTHIDGLDTLRSNTHNVIIQLSSPEDYKGGKVIINNELYDMEPGDGLIYDFKVLHEVRPVKEGIRYVMNIRFHSDKEALTSNVLTN